LATGPHVILWPIIRLVWGVERGLVGIALGGVTLQKRGRLLQGRFGKQSKKLLTIEAKQGRSVPVPDSPVYPAFGTANE
jgi:hypothetical protein